MVKRKSKRLPVGWKEVRVGLGLAKKSVLISCIKILWASSSKTAKRKVIKKLGAGIRSGFKKAKSRVKRRRSKSKKSKGRKKKPAWMVKGSPAAKRHMAKIRARR